MYSQTSSAPACDHSVIKVRALNFKEHPDANSVVVDGSASSPSHNFLDPDRASAARRLAKTPLSLKVYRPLDVGNWSPFSNQVVEHQASAELSRASDTIE